MQNANELESFRSNVRAWVADNFKMHGVTKIGIFRPLFCVNMLGKSTNYSTGTRPLCSTF